MKFDCGISAARLTAWLDDELKLERAEDAWIFSCEDGTCCIKVQPLESRSFKTVSIERAELSATGDETAIASFNKLFILRFVSAGG